MQKLTEPLFHWYLDSLYGKELVMALYTRPCRYARCAFCALPSLSAGGEQVTPQNINTQIDFILSQYTKEQLDEVAKVSIYTASSTLDQVCLPTRSLMYLLLEICDFPKLKMISLETRPEYVEDWELKAIRNVLGKNIKIEVGIGYETHDPYLRNEVLLKGLTEKSIHRLMKLLATNQTHLKAYLMLKPHHSLSEEGAIVEAQNGLSYLAKLGQEYQVPVSIHLNPTYIADGCPLATEWVEEGFEPPKLSSIFAVIESAEALNLPVFVGLDDEGLAIKNGVFQAGSLDRDKVIKSLLAYNHHQNWDTLVAESGYSA